MANKVFIERIEDGTGWWIAVDSTAKRPNGKRVELHGWHSISDPGSTQVADDMIRQWEMKRTTPWLRDEQGRPSAGVADA
jgi:hypothetical protein